MLDIETKSPYFQFLTWLSIIRNQEFCSSLWTCLHHMVILRSQKKITDFLMISLVERLVFAGIDHLGVRLQMYNNIIYVCKIEERLLLFFFILRHY